MRTAKVTLPFGGDLHDFRLTIAKLEELQDKTDCGPEEIAHRVITGTWKSPAEIREPIKLGLIGAGMDPTKALVLVERYAGEGCLMDLKPLVVGIIAAALNGARDEDGHPVGEPKGESETSLSPDERSGSPESGSEPESSAGDPETSKAPPSGSSIEPLTAGSKPTAGRRNRTPRQTTSSTPPS